MSKKKYKMRNSLKTIDIKEVRKYIEDNQDANIYFGTDSTRFKKNGEQYARFVTAIIVYQKDKNKIFGEVTYMKDYDNDPSRPQMRMFQEVQKVSSVVTELSDTLIDRDYSIHLDINNLEIHGSNCALQQAIGYIKGVHGITPIVKNDPSGEHPFAASCVADYLLKH